MSVHTIQSGVRSPSGPAGSERPFWRRRATLVFSSIILALVAGGLAAWSLTRPPPASGEPLKVAKFIGTQQFQSLPDVDKRPYMDALREGKEEIADAYARKQITAGEYETALLNAWIARTLKHVDEFSKLKDGKPRQQMLDRIVTKGEKKRISTTRPSPSIMFGRDPYELDTVKSTVASWPAERRAQWDEFKDALRKRRRERGMPVDSGIWY